MPTITRDDLADRVAAGAVALDEVFPDWYEEVPLSRLDMGTGWASEGSLGPSLKPECGCVGVWVDRATRPRTSEHLDFVRGLKRLGIRALVSLGFEMGDRDHVVRRNGVTVPGDEVYPMLTRLWQSEIRKRRG